MFTDKKSGRRIAVGYDLGETVSQISFCSMDEEEPETVSVVAGTEQYSIPTVLCKRHGVNQWFYGKEAVRKAKEGEGTLISDFLSCAMRGVQVFMEGETYDPAALMALFISRSLSLLYGSVPQEQVETVVFTVDSLEGQMVDALGRAAANLRLGNRRVFFQSHRESFYYYMLHQPRELWTYPVLACDYQGGALQTYGLECNKHTTPIVVFIRAGRYDGMEAEEWPEDEGSRKEQAKRLDTRFLEIAEELCRDSIYSTVYLLGEGFKETWADESLRFLCKNRRVFQGNNLYSKGACYAAKERIAPTETSKEYVYLGENKLKSNVGMRVKRRGLDSYYALLDAGSNWYEARSECECILESGNTFTVVVMPLTGREMKEVTVTLENLKERPERATRLKLRMDMTAAARVRIKITDLGFGELFPDAGQSWTEEFEV